MQKQIVTRQNADGTYDTVGMNCIRLFNPGLKTRRGIVNRLRRMHWFGRVKVEWFSDSIYVQPYATTYIDVVNTEKHFAG